MEAPGRRGPQLPSLTEEDKGEPTKGLVAIYRVLSSGSAGAPGEWMAWVAATTEYHAHYRPLSPEQRALSASAPRS